MFKAPVVLITTFAALGFACAASAMETQKWECAVDLHQGDNGTLSMDRKGEDLSGTLSFKRNNSVFENEVSGRWLGNEINIKRLLDASSSELMAGIVVSLGTKKVKIGGRFSAEYQGVWSADCDLVSSAIADSTNSSGSSVSNSIAPSTTSRINPSNPTNKDRIKFSARATHPDGIESISFFLDKKKIHTCEGTTCEFSGGRLAKGKHSWYVQAISKSGTKNTARPNELMVGAGNSTGNCSISGIATGPSAQLSSIYRINLLGPDNSNSLRASTEFKDSRYSFIGLPEGQYTLKIDTRADKGVLASPLSTTAKCQATGELTIDFDFR